MQKGEQIAAAFIHAKTHTLLVARQVYCASVC